MYWHKLDERSDRIDQRAMPMGSLHIRAWRRNRRWRLLDAYTGWSGWYDLVAYDAQWERDEQIGS